MSDRNYDFESNRPEVIEAKAAARERVLLARAKLHPVAQTVYAFFESITILLEKMGCLLIIILVILALLAPSAISTIFGG